MDTFIILTVPMFMCIFWGITLFILGQWKHDWSKHLLALGMLFFLLIFIWYATFFNNEINILLLWENIYILSLLSIYPLLFLYLEFIVSKKRPELSSLIRFIPAIVLTLYSVILYLYMDAQDKEIYVQQIIYKNKVTNSWGIILYLQQTKRNVSVFILTVQLFCLTSYALWRIKRYKSTIIFLKEATTNNNVKSHYMFLSFIIGSAFFSLFADIVGIPFLNSYPIVMKTMVTISAGIIFTIGYWGYKFNIKEKSWKRNDYEYNSNQYFRTTEDKESEEKIQQELIILMENEKIFTQEGLKVNDVAKMLCSNRTYISNIINSRFNTSFTELINDYRVQYAKKILSQPENSEYSLSEIRKVSGFSSDSSFYRIFKQKEGITPLEFKKKIQKKVRIIVD